MVICRFGTRNLQRLCAYPQIIGVVAIFIAEAIHVMPRDPDYAMLRQDLWFDLVPIQT